MKTTFDISDALLAEAKRIAARERTTLRALVEQGLRQIVAEKKRPPGQFKLRKASVARGWLRPEIENAGWRRILELAYEGRGA